MKSGYVALTGRPNVGKSTLMNSLLGQKIAITSNRPQTTRERLETVYTDERGQIIFVDTPGVYRPGNKLDRYMERATLKAIKDADVIILLVEPVSSLTPEDEDIACMLNKLKRKDLPIILVINKVDTVTQNALIQEVISLYEAKCRLDDVVGASALTGKNLDLLLDEIFKYLPEGPLYYDEDTVTLIPMRKIVEELIRKQLLKYLRDEIPHGTAVQLTKFHQRRRGLYDIEGDIICEKEQHKGIIIGKGGKMLKEISTAAREEIEVELGEKVYLRLFVKLRKNWRNNELYIKSYGYGKT